MRSCVPRAAFGSGRLRLQHGRRTVVNFGSNDYLGIANRPAAAELGETPGRPIQAGLPIRGSGASPLVSGFSPTHAALEQAIVRLENCEAARLLSTGYAANVALLSTLPEAGDVILSDALNHASIIDGCRLSRAERFIYPHGDVAAVRALLRDHRGRFNRAYLMTDTVFGMDGDVAPLKELCDLADQYDTVMMVDEAHGTGVFGEHGGGVCEALGVCDRVPIRVGTLSKAVGAMGGFIAGPQIVIDYLTNKARPFIYSTAMPDAVAEAGRIGLEIIREQPELRTRLATLREQLMEGLRPIGGPLLRGLGSSPIVPLIIGDNAKALHLGEQLFDAGFYVPVIRPPTVPERTARLRISLSAGHTFEEVDNLLGTLRRLLNGNRTRC